MNFVKKIVSSIRDLFSKKAESVSQKNNAVGSEEIEISNESKFLTLLKQVSVFIFAYLKRFLIFVLGLINTMMQPMIKISKKHPIAFWAAVILHASLLFGLLYANVEKWDTPQVSATSQAAPVQAVMIDMEIIEAEQDRLKDVEKQKQTKLKNEEKRSETAKKDQKVAEQEALKAKAQKVFAEVKRKAEEAKAKEAEQLASKAVEKVAEAETKVKLEEKKAKEAAAKRVVEEAKTKEAEIQVLEAEKQKAAAEALRKAEEVKTKLAELKRKAEEAKTKEAELLAKEATKEAQEAEILAKEAEILAKQAEEKRIEEELKAKDAVKEAEKQAEEKAKEAEILAQEVAKQVKKAEEKRKAEEEKTKLAEAKRKTEEEKAKEAEEKRKIEEEKAKEAEKEKDEATKLTEEERIKLDELEAERTATQLAFENEQYNRLLTQEVQAEQDLEREARIADQRTILENAWVANIAARVRAMWRYQGAEDDWTAEVYVIQDRDGTVMAVDVRDTNVGNSSKAKAFKDSIERAVKKSSPFPSAPDEAVFQKEILFIFVVN